MSSERQSSLLYCANEPNKELLPDKFAAELGIMSFSLGGDIELYK